MNINEPSLPEGIGVYTSTVVGPGGIVPASSEELDPTIFGGNI